MNRIIKYFALFLAILLPTFVNAHDFEIDGIYYRIVNGNEVAVSFRGNYYYSDSNEYSGVIIIPETVCYDGVTYTVISIDNGAFYECTGLTRVEIPNSIKSIDDQAFRGCSGLNSINLPNSLITIGWAAFDHCTSLTEIEIPNSVTTIEGAAFSTTGITSIEVPSSVTAIKEGVFYQCYELKNIKLPNTIKYFGREAFCYCRNLLSIEIPNSVDSIGPEAFYFCKQLTYIEIPNSVKYIGDWAFYDCSNLRSIVIPNSVTTIGKKVFNRSMEVTLCGNIETVGESVFSGVSKLFISGMVSSIPAFGFSPSEIYCFGTTPPSCQEGTFSSYASTLHVPASSLASYFTAPIWERFNNILGNSVAPQSIYLTPTELEIPLGEQIPLTATVIPSNAYPNTITWKSTNTDIATISNGIVSALSVGECDIIASCLDVQSICHVVVKGTTITISLDQYEARVLPNHIITLTVTSSSDLMPELVVHSSNSTIAAARVVNNNIQIVGIKEGTTTITVGSADGTAIPATCLVTVYTELGDLNCDGFVNISDVTSLINYLLSDDSSQISIKNADVNGDERINISDVTALINKLLSGN